MSLQQSTNSPILVANWKQNLSLSEAMAFCEALQDIEFAPNMIGIAPQSVQLHALANKFKTIQFGAQDISPQSEGPYTGAVGANAILEVGGNFTLIGHSERRNYFHEKKEMLENKLRQAWREKLQIIYCIGESRAQYEAGRTEETLMQQLEIFSPKEGDIIAYEPVWAISDGKSPSKTPTEKEIDKGQRLIKKSFPKCPVLYGGSVNPNNMEMVLNIDSVDGALIGGASLKIESFAKLVEYATSIKS